MIEIIVPAVILAKIKRYRLRYLLSAWPFYIVMIPQCVLIFFEVCAFCGNYYFVRFASPVKTAIILSFLFPMFAYQLYKPAVAGSASILAGTLLNRFAIWQNNGKMPVFPSLSYLTGYVKPDTFRLVSDIHILGGSAVRYKFLTDYIDLGYCILSPGDLLIHFFSFLMFYYTIKGVQARRKSVEYPS